MPSEARLYIGGPTAEQLRAEAAKQRQVPGIVFADGPSGRRARIAGTGIEVFEIARTYRAVNEDRARLVATYDWLSARQIDAALSYATAYPDEIASWLRQEDALESSCRGAQPAL